MPKTQRQTNMPARLFSLKHVPDDEADEVRALLTEHEIEYFETEAGGWGISPAALWLRDEAQLEAARALVDAYQGKRAVRMRAAYEAQKREGQQRTLFDVIRENPVRFIAYLAVIAAILYFSTKPFIDLGK
jgi:hypothetical protein